jgi:predicted nucleotidyltransferase
MEPSHAIDALRRYFEATPVPLACAYLFGSYARNEQRRGSDLDVAVLLPLTSRRTLAGPLSTLRGDLERLLGRTVDVIDLRRAPVDLTHRILRDGQLLVERDRNERVQFEVQARSAYFDLLPHIERYRAGRLA